MTGSETWHEVDEFVDATLVRPDESLEQARAASDRAGLPPIAVSAAQGKLLHLIARMIGARRVLEIGTLGGYSAIWMARALPAGGQLVSLELDPRHAEIARSNVERAGLASVVEIRVGPALDTLAVIEGDPFDLTFIDADKERIPEYFDRSVHLSRPGAVIVVDNVVRAGALVQRGADDARVLGVRRFHEELAGRDDVDATTIQTVGSKGYDGFTLAVVRG